MFSIICVYNDRAFLERRLLSSLTNQSVPYEFIPVDNTTSKFSNAASALNYGALQANGDFLLFVHQDIALLSPNWLADAENVLNDQEELGWAGVAGCAEIGELRGFLIDRDWLFGLPDDNLQEVQTLDECVLIHKKIEGKEYFDENIPNWHAYGVDACCTAIAEGKKNFVLSLETWHDSKLINLKALDISHKYVWEKHKGHFRSISTTCGVLPHSYDWEKTSKSQVTNKERLRYRIAGKLTEGMAFSEGLDSLTKNFEQIDCLHKKAQKENVIVKAFTSLPVTKRKIIHHFNSLYFDDATSDTLVIAPDLTSDLMKSWTKIKKELNRFKNVFVCINLEKAIFYPTTFLDIYKHSTKKSAFVDELTRTILVFHLNTD